MAAASAPPRMPLVPQPAQHTARPPAPLPSSPQAPTLNSPPPPSTLSQAPLFPQNRGPLTKVTILATSACAHPDSTSLKMTSKSSSPASKKSRTLPTHSLHSKSPFRATILPPTMRPIPTLPSPLKTVSPLHALPHQDIPHLTPPATGPSLFIRLP